MHQQPVEIPVAVVELLPALRAMSNMRPHGSAFGGAHAKGIADAASDLDVYVFAPAIASDDMRTQLAHALADSPPRSWSVPGAFTQAGADFVYRGQHVEVWLRNNNLIDQTLDECERGVVKQDFVTWTVMGFYNHCALSDLAHMLVFNDADRCCTIWRRRCLH